VSDKNEFEHELKNFLAIILGYADLLIEETFSAVSRP